LDFDRIAVRSFAKLRKIPFWPVIVLPGRSPRIDIRETRKVAARALLALSLRHFKAWHPGAADAAAFRHEVVNSVLYCSFATQ
jgi:hypothetical protein